MTPTLDDRAVPRDNASPPSQWQFGVPGVLDIPLRPQPEAPAAASISRWGELHVDSVAMTTSGTWSAAILSRLAGHKRPTKLRAQPESSVLTLEQLRGLLRPDFENAVRGRCLAVQVDSWTVLCRVLGRYKLMVDSRDLGLAPHLMLDGYWEMWCTELMLRQIRPGMVAVDVGANLGYFSVLMADLVGAGGRVVAVEPNPYLATLTERNLALNGFQHTARVERIAAAAAAQDLAFRYRTSNPKNGHVVEAAGAPPHDGDTAQITVRGRRLDDVIGGPVDFIKIDVEGAEEQTWAGLTRTLDASPDIIVLMEFNPARCRTPEAALAEFAARFPLRELTLDHGVQPVAPADVMSRDEDTLLVLTRLPL